MTTFGYIFYSIFGTISIGVPLYMILKNGIKRTDFTSEKIKNMELKYGGVSLVYLSIEIIAILVFVY